MRDPEKKRRTSTSTFGVSSRESHDSSAFYERFSMPEISPAKEIAPPKVIDEIFVGNSAAMAEVETNSVALVVTSPPYFAGKAYETALGEGHIPATYAEYLAMLESVFAECVRTLEPGGRIAVNVANLGRRPYRSLSADVIQILQDRLRLLLRGEVIWVKAEGASGSCAWGSFQRPANPVLRDLTERVVIASKGRFDRARTPRERAKDDLPSETTIFRDEFMEATTDLWEFPAESATRVGHPAPFPVELPERLIHLHTYRGDLVLDPFMGSGTTAVAAVRTGRHYVGYDMDPEYVAAARLRVDTERQGARVAAATGTGPLQVRLPSAPEPVETGEDFYAKAIREGRSAKELVATALDACGFADVKAGVALPNGVQVSFRAADRWGRLWYFDVFGGFTTSRAGLRRTEALWRALGKASVVHASATGGERLVLLTTDLPAAGSPADKALVSMTRDARSPEHDRPIHDVILLTDRTAVERLRDHSGSATEG